MQTAHLHTPLHITWIVGNYHINLWDILGKGEFGIVYSGKDIANNWDIAAKLERADQIPADQSGLLIEYSVYTHLQSQGHGPSIPYMLWYGETTLDYIPRRIMVFQRLGRSLHDLHGQFSRHFTMKTVAMIAHQMLSALGFLHSNNILHLDVKPENIVTGTRNTNCLYLIDFGLCQPYLNKSEGYTWKFVGTLKFCGLNAHLKKQLSRRDDLQSLVFTLIELRRGSLPWQTNQDHEIIHTLKKNFSDEHEVLREFLNYSRNIGFYTAPDYDLYKRKFNDILNQEGNNDGVMDWNIHPKATYHDIATRGEGLVTANT